MDPHSSRVCNTKESLEELIMDITSHDLNRQIQKLVANYKRTGREEFKLDAEYLRSEFDTWWNDETSSFCSPYWRSCPIWGFYIMMLEITYTLKPDKKLEPQKSWTYFVTDKTDFADAVKAASRYFKVFVREHGWGRRCKLVSINKLKNT